MATGGLNFEPFRRQGHMAHIRQPRLDSDRNPCGVLDASAFRLMSLKRFKSLPWISTQVDILSFVKRRDASRTPRGFWRWLNRGGATTHPQTRITSPLICTGARRNPATCGTHPNNRTKRFARLLRAGVWGVIYVSRYICV